VPVDLRTEVGGVLLLVGPQLRTAGITVEVVPAEPPLVLGRHVAVQQVLVNLLLNARDALKDLPPARPRRIRIELMDDSEAAMVRLAISDTGGGVAPDNIGRVFEPFFTTKPPGEGTGLGLALCLLFMQSFSGDIAVRNDPQGAVFTLGFRTAPPAAV
jgi:two-component system C4-dicarboxylate transport sensor histidine kinase DctB